MDSDSDEALGTTPSAVSPSAVSTGPLDPPSPRSRSLACVRGKARVRDSGLWNQNHVDEDYDPAFLDVMEALVERIGM